MMNIQIKRGTSLALAALNPVLAAGEPCLETDTNRIKYGNGTSAWNDLSYSNADITTIDGNDPSPPPSVLPGEFNPAVLSGLSLWFESADSDSASVSNQRLSQWINKKNNAYASQTRFSLRPNVVNIVKNKYVLSFDGENDRLLGETNLEQNLTAFVVFKTNTHPKNTTVLSTDSYKLCSFDNNGKLGTTIGSSHYSTETVTDAELVLNFNTPTITDSSPKNSAITKYGNAQVVNNGKFDKCLYLDGVNSYIEAPAQTLGTGNFTIEFWVKPTAEPTTPWTTILTLGGATPQEIRISQNINGWGPGFFIPRNNITGNRLVSTPSSSMPLNNWSHVALVREGTLVKYYINGILKKTLSNAAFNYTSTDSLRIGYGFYPWDGYFKGYIDGVRVIKRAIYSGDNFSLPTKQPGSFYSTNVNNEEPLLYSCEINGTNLTTKINGVTNYTGAIPVLSDAIRFSVGSDIDGNQAFDGDIAAVVVYNRVLSQLEYNQVKSYLHLRWTDEPSLLDRLKAYWPLNEINGPRLDISDNAKILVVGEEAGYSQDVPSSTTSQTDITILNNTVTPIDLDLKKIAYGNGIYVGIDTAAASTSYRTSTNGTSWTTRTLPLNKKWNNVQYVNDRFIIVGDSFVALTSTNGITWTQVNIQDMTPSPKNAALLLNFNNSATDISSNNYPIIQNLNTDSLLQSYYYTSLLMNFNGTNGSSTFTDSSVSNKNITVVGNPPPQINSSVSKFGGSSVQFNGNSYLNIDNPGSAFQFSGAFTMEVWANFSTVQKEGHFLQSAVPWGGYNYNFGFYRYPRPGIHGISFSYGYWGSNGVILHTAYVPPINEWHHYAVTRDVNNVWRFFVDGVETPHTVYQENRTHNPGENLVGSSTKIIGGNYDTTNRFEGYLDDLRVVKNKAMYTSNFTPPSQALSQANGMIDPLLVMHFDGPTFTDSSPSALSITSIVNPINSISNNISITANGAPAHSTTQSKFGGSSLYLNGSVGTYLSIPNDAGMRLGIGAFTIEAWVYPTRSAAGTIISQSVVDEGAGNNTGWYMYIENGHPRLLFQSINGNVPVIAPTLANPIVNRWAHIALVRSGTNFTLYVDGVSVGSYTSLYNMDAAFNIRSDTPTLIGQHEIQLGGSVFQGYIDDFRIVKGSAVYTSNFTPPTQALTEITNTGITTPILLRFDNIGPSSIRSKFGGSSAYFNGNNYIRTSSFSWSSPITIEFWMYAEAGNDDGNTHHIITTSNSWSDGKFGLMIASGRRLAASRLGISQIISGNNAFSTNTWNHIAFVVDSNNNGYIFVNGSLVASGPGSNVWINTSSPITVGKSFQGNNEAGFIGNIDELRVSNVALYVSNFTPPTSPFSNTNTESTLPSTSLISSEQSKFGGTSLKLSRAYNSYVSIDNTALTTPLFTDGEFTMECWFRANSDGGTSCLMTTRHDGSGKIMCIAASRPYADPNQAPKIWCGYWEGWWRSSIIGPAFNLNTWYHVAMVVSKSSNFMKLYVDGNLVGSSSGLENMNSSWYPINNLYIGRRWDNNDGNNQYFDGYIDDAKITYGQAYISNFTPPSTEAVVSTPVYPIERKWQSVAYGNNKYVGISNSDMVSYSSDSTSWTNTPKFIYKSMSITRSSNNSSIITATCANHGLTSGTTIYVGTANLDINGEFTVTVTDTNTFTYPAPSSGPTTFTTNAFFYLPSTVPNKSWDNIVYGNNKFIVTGINSDSYAYSVDGASWNYYTVGQNWHPYTALVNGPKKLIYRNNKFIAGNSNTWRDSSDGLTWSDLVLAPNPSTAQRGSFSPLADLPMAYTNNNYTFILSSNAIFTGDSLSSLSFKRIIDSNSNASNVIAVNNHILISGNQSDNTPIVSNLDLSTQVVSTTSALFDGLEYLETELASSAESFAVWIKIPPINITNRSSTEILGQWAGAAGSWRLLYDHNNGGLIVDVGQNRVSLGLSGAFVANDSWRFVAGSYNNNVYKLYMVGSENDYVYSTTATILLTGLLNGYNLRVGSLSLNPSSSFIGQIDNLALWDRAISESEVMKLYYNGRASNTL